MPNWCQIQFTVRGTPEAVGRFKAGVEGMDEGEKQEFDFNRILPMPPELHIESGSTGDIGYAAFYGDASGVLQYPWVMAEGITTVDELRAFLDKKDPRYYEMGTKYHENTQNHGHATWYSWSTANWGTKWNACHIDLTDNGESGLEYRFDTAWSFPEPIFYGLAEKFPDVTIDGTMDEEGGYFYGSFSIKEGELTLDYEEGVRPGGPYDYNEDDEEEEEEAEGEGAGTSTANGESADA
jgi:hypothetical protein